MLWGSSHLRHIGEGEVEVEVEKGKEMDDL